ncbi:TetR/AcrR family transcriptional regulator [Cupriavidus sp. AcVe19-6a]|uniref:TetR/AcrR family transcriptional regulator n=1 Tax=Cupriavidus sp. AcVe19-6a TaxID=2821358 RepID=UPI001AE57F2A|nr:TetR/AcrR family transcriptional regulator [Cupriavidus sp. AcVe19-6a]MBP0638809.1 TetR/AcrR family transcriptional regulator [Cupriavidus sp. AcVe19-6a]
MMSTIPQESLHAGQHCGVPNHRSRVAHSKRVATRARIVSAILDLVADPANLTVSIEDVVKAAGIARGTFYKHFTSMDEALLAMGREVRDQFTAAILPDYDVLTHPLQRFSCGMYCFLAHAHADRRWAGFALREELVPGRSLLLDCVTADLRAGAYHGCMEIDDLQAAVDLVLGCILEGIRTLCFGRMRDPRHYIDTSIRMALRSLGADKTAAAEAAAFARAYARRCEAVALTGEAAVAQAAGAST